MFRSQPVMAVPLAWQMAQMLLLVSQCERVYRPCTGRAQTIRRLKVWCVWCVVRFKTPADLNDCRCDLVCSDLQAVYT